MQAAGYSFAHSVVVCLVQLFKNCAEGYWTKNDRVLVKIQSLYLAKLVRVHGPGNYTPDFHVFIHSLSPRVDDSSRQVLNKHKLHKVYRFANWTAPILWMA